MRKTTIAVAYAIFLVLVLEVGARAYLALALDTPFFTPRSVLFTYYPKLKQVSELEIESGDARFDILLLGASVINERWGNIDKLLRSRLSERLGERVRVHNLSMPSQTSLDSYYKYLNLAHQSFDLVILYQGINEVRANNCPPEVFRADYSHYHWYEQVNRIHAHGEINILAWPFVLSHGLSLVREKIGLTRYLPKNRPRDEWLDHGKQIKTAPSFRWNVARIIELAHARSQPLVLMTFAFYVPEGNWPSRFEVKHSEWGVRRSRVRVWGRDENVVAGIEAHNAVIDHLAAENDEILFVDQNDLMPKDKRHFTDICHFTAEGCRSFVDNLVEPTVRFLGRLE